MHSAIVKRLSTDQAAFSDWLAKLNTLNGMTASNDFYKFISALKKEAGNIDPSILHQVVMQLTPTGLYLSDFLEKNYLNNLAPRIAQLNIYLMRQLASLHLRAAEAANEEQKIDHYNYALQIQGIGHYLSVLSYEHPSSSIWSEMGIAYRAAVDQQLISHVSHRLLPTLQKLDSIEKALKRNLLFAVCDAYRLARPAIQTLFKFCNDQYNHLELHRLGAGSNDGFCWPYTTKQPPFPIQTVAEGKNGLIFNAEPLAKAQRQGLIHWPISEPSPLVNALTNYKSLINSPSTVLPSNQVFISEFERVAAFYNAHIRMEQVWIVNSPTTEHLNFSSLELLPENQDQKERVSHEEIWGKPKDEILKLVSTDFGALKSTKTNSPGFFVSEAIRAKLRDRDLLALYGRDLKPYLAIVRRLEPGKSSNIQKALIEILPGDVKPLSVLDEKHPALAIVLKQQDSTQAFLPPGKYATGSSLQTGMGLVTLERLMEATTHFMRYQISPASGNKA